MRTSVTSAWWRPYWQEWAPTNGSSPEDVGPSWRIGRLTGCCSAARISGRRSIRKDGRPAGELRRQREALDRLAAPCRKPLVFSTLRYQGGADSYLRVLNAERDLFQGQLAQAQLRLQELLAFVDLYRALGGGLQ